MAHELKLLCVLAHPDDESMSTGGILAKYSAEGVKTYLVTATRGERGWLGNERAFPGQDELGKIRENELLDAAEVLDIRYVDFLDYLDGELDQAHPAEVIAKIVGHIRHVRPDVVVTFGPDGGYGHPDHIAISQFTTAAVIEAAHSNSVYYQNLAPHCVSKLYYKVVEKGESEAYQSAFGDLFMRVDGAKRYVTTWPDWMITTRIDTWKYWRTVSRAIARHRTQLPKYHVLEQLPEVQRKLLWGTQYYYRAFSLVNGGRHVEEDLFEGLR